MRDTANAKKYMKNEITLFQLDYVLFQSVRKFSSSIKINIDKVSRYGSVNSLSHVIRLKYCRNPNMEVSQLGNENLANTPRTQNKTVF